MNNDYLIGILITVIGILFYQMYWFVRNGRGWKALYEAAKPDATIKAEMLAIKAQRKVEVERKEHAMTAHPLYVVYDVQTFVTEYNSDYSPSISHFEDGETEYVRYSQELEESIPAEADNKNWDQYWMFWHDEDGVFTPFTPYAMEAYEKRNEEDVTFEDDTGDMRDFSTFDKAVKLVKHDAFKTVCFTRAAAIDFIEREKHNMYDPRIYVHYGERRNLELQTILRWFGDK